MFFNHPLKEIAARNLGIQLPGLTSSPAAKAPVAKGKAPPPPKSKPPPPKKAAAPPPKWKGPAPSNDWKANCLVNWKPIREASRLEGSVWQKLLRKKGVTQVPTGLVDDLNQAFMSKASTEQRPRRSFASRPSVVRLLNRSKALQADILHSKLVRSGIRSPEQVAWATKSRLRPEVTPVEKSDDEAKEQGRKSPPLEDALYGGHDPSEGASQDPLKKQSGAASESTVADKPPEVPREISPEEPVTQELSGDVLEALLGLLALVDADQALAFRNGRTTAPAELFLQELLHEVSDVEVLRNHVRNALHIARFEEAKSVEVVLLRGTKTVRAVIESEVIPIFLEGVLLVGNYVNSSSTALSGAVGISLESLAKLAHTRTKQGTQQVNALHFVVGHLQRTHPNLVERLAEDLEDCRSLQGLDTMALSDMIQGFVSQVQSVEALIQNQSPDGSSMPDALEPSRVQHFLSGARPQVYRLTELLKELKQASADLRTWFAEPQERQLVDMLDSLIKLREALPVETIKMRSRKKVGKRPERKKQREKEDVDQGRTMKTENAAADGGAPSLAELASASSTKGPADVGKDEMPANSQVAPISGQHVEDREPELLQSSLPDPWADPLNSLTRALTYLQESSQRKASDEPTSTEPSEVDAYEAPLANLEAVLAQFGPTAEAEAAEESARGHLDSMFDFDELDEMEEQLEQEHLTVLQSVLARTKNSVPPANAFDDQLTELQSVLARMKQ